MKELYVEDLAGHNGPLHAVIIARLLPKRCSWVRAGEVSSLETYVRNADPVCVVGRPYTDKRYASLSAGFAGSLDPQHVRKPLCTRTGRATLL
jgi:hypothetical protein